MLHALDLLIVGGNGFVIIFIGLVAGPMIMRSAIPARAVENCKFRRGIIADLLNWPLIEPVHPVWQASVLSLNHHWVQWMGY